MLRLIAKVPLELPLVFQLREDPVMRRKFEFRLIKYGNSPDPLPIWMQLSCVPVSVNTQTKK